VEAVLRLLPARDHAVVAGWPDDEGNSVEVVRALPGQIAGRVYWLVDAEPDALGWLLDGAEGRQRVRLLRKRSLTGFLTYATARLVFFTHGLYGSPSPPKRKTFVNLWHGDGPKRTDNPRGSPRIPSSYVASGTALWGRYKADFFGVPRDRLLVTGNPRIDQFARPLTDDQLEALGLPAGLPPVLWLPTYRGARGPADQVWEDSRALSSSSDLHDMWRAAVVEARRVGVALAVKPHPLDADDFAAAGMQVILNDDLRRVRGSFYQLVARAAGIITDYSSVWTDFLALDRPIGFYCPDLEEYITMRGLNVSNLSQLLPGPLLERPDDVARFLASCVVEPAESACLRAESVRRIGAQTRLGATARLLRLVVPDGWAVDPAPLVDAVAPEPRSSVPDALVTVHQTPPKAAGTARQEGNA
jgi:CDP-glycerol glycerophosphotransferase